MPRRILDWRVLVRFVVWVLLTAIVTCLLVVAKFAWLASSFCLWTLADLHDRLENPE
jgi:hypothetical protein